MSTYPETSRTYMRHASVRMALLHSPDLDNQACHFERYVDHKPGQETGDSSRYRDARLPKAEAAARHMMDWLTGSGIRKTPDGVPYSIASLKAVFKRRMTA